MSAEDNQKLEQYLECADLWIWETDDQHRVTFLSNGFEKTTGLERDELIGQTPGQFARHQEESGMLKQRDAMMEARKPFSNVKSRLSSGSGQVRWIKTSGSPVFDADNKFVGYRGTGYDVTAEVRITKDALTEKRQSRMQQTLLSNIGKISGIGAWALTVADGKLIWSPETYEIYELPIDSYIDLDSAMNAYDEEGKAILRKAINNAQKEGSRFDVTLPFTTAKGNRRWVHAVGLTDMEGDQPTQIFGTFQDITKQQEQHLKVESIAMRDSLTGIGNRHMFNDELKKRIEARAVAEDHVILCMADLDKFKEINDLYGHAVGDEMLGCVAHYLSKQAGDDGFVARIGGDEFALIFTCPAGEVEPSAFINQRIDKLEHRFETAAGVIEVKLCLGFAACNGTRVDSARIMRDADFALHSAKASGAGNIREFDPSMADTFHRRVVVTQQFQRAVGNGEVVPHYQPIVELETGRLSGLEALARWAHPTRGIIAPSLYMQVFEDNKICFELGELMLKKICADMQRWHQEGIFFGRVGYNATAAELKQPGFALKVLSALSKHGLQSHHLVIEITETTMFKDIDSIAQNQLKELREAGVAIALDDFGTGYSSLTHLKSLPFNILKIDKTFVKNVISSKTDKSIIRSLIDLGQDIGYTTVAEGIEVQAELEYLRSIGCHRGQGYFFSKPKSLRDITSFLAGQNSDQKTPTRIAV